MFWFFFFQRAGRIRTARPCAAGQATSPVGCCLVRGSQPVGMSNKRLRFTVRREDLNKAAARSAASKATVRLCLARGFQRVGMSNKRTTVHPGEMELSLFVFHPDAVQPVCDKGLPVQNGGAAGFPDGSGQAAGGVEGAFRSVKCLWKIHSTNHAFRTKIGMRYDNFIIL